MPKAAQIRASAVIVATVPAALAGNEPAQAAFPGSNGELAFASNRDGDFEVFVMKANGDRQRKRTNNSLEDTDPDWQPIP